MDFRYFLLIVQFFGKSRADTKCDSCKLLVKSFRTGMLNTEKANFGGGNTAWEEEKVGKFSTSETRLVEILEYVCRKTGDKKVEIEDEWFPTLTTDKSADHMCHSLVEEYEETIENWYFHKQKNNPNFYQWLCIDQLKKCCPNGTYGNNCDKCVGTVRGPCNQNGECNGDGTRSGTGKCKCKSGYIGDACDQCATSYFEAINDAAQLKCSSCHAACASKCSGGGSDACDECRSGYEWFTNDDAKRYCRDIDECANDESLCTDQENTYCLNFPGKYSCECKQGYKKIDGKCTLDIIAPPSESLSHFVLFGHALTPEMRLRIVAFGGLIIAMLLIVFINRSPTLLIFLMMAVAAMLYIEFGGGDKWIRAGISPDTGAIERTEPLRMPRKEL